MLKRSEQERILRLAHRLVGNGGIQETGRSLVFTNVQRRIDKTGMGTLSRYLRLASTDDVEFAHLISAMTIHHTHWFREQDHFRILDQHLRSLSPSREEPFLFEVLACSTGEEAYSFAFVLESMRRRSRGFDYRVHASDIDPISISRAMNAVYSTSRLPQLPPHFREFVDIRRSDGKFAVGSEVRQRVRFEVSNILQKNPIRTIGPTPFLVAMS